MKLRTAKRGSTPQIIPFTQKNEKSFFWRLLPSIIFFGIVALIIMLIYGYYYLPRAVGLIYTEKHEIGPNRNAIIEKILVKQGDQVHKGDIVVRLETMYLKALLKQNELELLVAQQGVTANEAKLKLQQDDLRLKLEDSQILRSVELLSAESSLNQARAIIDSTIADLGGAAIEVERYAKLVPSGASAKSKLDNAQTRYNMDKKIIENYTKVIDSNMQRQQQAEERYNEYVKKQESINVPISQIIPPIMTNAKVAEAQIDITKALLDYSLLKSPVDGIVSNIYKRENAGLQPGDIVLSIDNSNFDTVEAYVREEWASNLALNKKIRLVPRLKGHEPLKGTINYISPIVTIIPPEFTSTYNQQVKEKGIRFTVKLDKPWAGPAGATFDIILLTSLFSFGGI